MFSTFLIETDTSKSTNSSIKISVPIQKKLAVSTPITIPKKSEGDLQSEYELNLNFFNPSKMTPPDCWKTRLEQRIKSLYDDNLLEKE